MKAFRPKSAIRPKAATVDRHCRRSKHSSSTPAPTPRRHRHLDARPRRRRLGLRAHRARAAPAGGPAAALHLPARAGAAGDDQQRLRRCAPGTTSRWQRHRAPARRAAASAQSQAQVEALIAREKSRGMPAAASCSRASRRAARSRCRRGCATPSARRHRALSTYLPLAGLARRARPSAANDAHPDLHGPRHAGSGRAGRARRALARAAPKRGYAVEWHT